MSEVRPRWANLPPAERDRRIAQSAADRARAAGDEPARPARWADLPAAERRRREAQRDADRARAASGDTTVSEAERQRRAMQSRADREAAKIEDAIHRTVYGGDINMMSKDDW
ncbi:hypothetical protein [Micromonospora sp. WMMD737]|uniref:hypothetical protein n=1 Tax=Micromonospora sp. WMMD737 TaxID=3404113 RepID=UPI003B938257